MNEIGEIPEEKRKQLGDYIEKLKNENKLGFNQLAIKSGINVRSLNEILYAKGKRINPFSLQRLGYALRIDYKELYKIIGYLSEEDFQESNTLKLKLESCEKKCEELEKKLKGATRTHNIINHGNQAIGVNSQITMEMNNKTIGGLDLTGLPEDRIEELKRYVEFLKTK